MLGETLAIDKLDQEKHFLAKSLVGQLHAAGSLLLDGKEAEQSDKKPEPRYSAHITAQQNTA